MPQVPYKDVKRWWHDAACLGVDTEMFFPDDGKELEPAMASTCFDCPVKWECRLVGMAEHHGIYGNMTARTRRDLRRRIFGRLFGVEIDRNDELDSFRGIVEQIAKEPGNVLLNMAKAGFNIKELAAFTARTRYDEHAARRHSRERELKADDSWLHIKHGGRSPEEIRSDAARVSQVL